MKTKITFFKLSLLVVALLLTTSVSAWADTFYTCSGTSLNLDAGTPATGITYLWDVKKDGASGSFTGYPSSTAPTSFTAPGVYEVILVSKTSSSTGSCASDPVSNTIIVLPALTAILGAPSNPVYCEANSTIVSSDLTFTLQNFPTAYSTDLGVTYSYSVVKDTDAPVDGATFGTIDALTGKYTLTTTTPGVYKITGKVIYKQLGTNKLLGDGCPATTTVQTVTVTAKPTKPTITITAL